jgi:hypothetical protein
MNSVILNLKNTLDENLLASKSQDGPLERLNSVLKNLDNTMFEITRYLREHSFDTSTEEIDFYKVVKPQILAHRIEEGLRYSLVINKPIGTNEIQLNYFEAELKALQSFFRLNSFYYQYYRNKFSELDRLFFLRNAGPLTVPITEIPAILEGEFSPPMSYLFAKFLAYENVQYFILEMIAELKNPEIKKGIISPGNSDLKWTGDSINIVELAYGLWLTGQLNNGNASLNQIVRWLESNLHVSIGIVQRRFDEIGRRKRLSPTRFIDQMRENILQKIEGENAR